MSAIYKVWQDKLYSPVVGFYHYRRFLNFSVQSYQEPWNKVKLAEVKSLSLTPENSSIIAGGSVIVTGMPHRLECPVSDWYSKCHIASDYELLVRIMSKENPLLLPEIEQQKTNKFMYANNIFLTSWKQFDEMCQSWFSVLRTVASLLDWPRGLGEYQDRDIAFLSERFFDAWLRYKQRIGVTIVERPILFIDN